MREPCGEDFKGFLTQVLHTPGDTPARGSSCSAARGRLYQESGYLVVALLPQSIAPPQVAFIF
jgi:hypothetical protein